ncbi:MAG: glycosyltransferase [Flavobacteriales bacterium]|nr:glycosyltransferase [Flavobacteriales bacterium]
MADLNGKLEGGLRVRGIHPVAVPGKPLVSIVTVVYNGAATLERTIQSVLAQDHPSIEYIIVDGGSKDGTLDIVRRYEDRIAYWISAKDKGIYDAMNKGRGALHRRMGGHDQRGRLVRGGCRIPGHARGGRRGDGEHRSW